jgi:hypothetical protein
MNFVNNTVHNTDSVRIMYKHRNVWEYFKKQELLIYTLHFKILFTNKCTLLLNT